MWEREDFYQGKFVMDAESDTAAGDFSKNIGLGIHLKDTSKRQDFITAAGGDSPLVNW